jgi:hypothetical protein
MAIGTGAAILGGAALGALGGSKKSGNVTSTQNSGPWAGAQPYLNDAFRQAQGIFYGGAPIGYGDGKPRDFAGIHGQGVDQLSSTIRGDYLNPSSNPFFSGAVNDALGLAKSQFAGQYGGQAGGNLGNSGYQEMLMRTLGNLSTNAFADNYSRERQNQLNATQLASNYQFAPAQAYASIVNGAPGGTSTTSQPYFTNPLGGALGGAMAGLQLYNMFPKAPEPSPQASYPPALIPGYGG